MCGLLPDQFSALTPLDYLDVLEAAEWREAREMRKIAYYVAHLLSPNFKPGITIGEAMRSIAGEDQGEEIQAVRKKRIAHMFEDGEK